MKIKFAVRLKNVTVKKNSFGISSQNEKKEEKRRRKETERKG